MWAILGKENLKGPYLPAGTPRAGGKVVVWIMMTKAALINCTIIIRKPQDRSLPQAGDVRC